MTTPGTHVLRPSTSSPSSMPLNWQSMYTMIEVVHVMVVQLKLSPLIPLSPKAKLNKVTISKAILIVEPQLSLRLWVLSSWDMGHSGLCLWLIRMVAFRNVWKSVKWVLEMVWFFNLHLIFAWSFRCFKVHLCCLA